MTATPTFRASRGHYRFRQVVAMEWIKLRTLRSTWWTLAVTAGGAIAMAVVIGLNTKNGSGDLTNNALAGIILMVMTSEYTSGLIRATLAAIPNRPVVLAAKAAVFGGVTLVLGEVAAFIAFLAGSAALPQGIAAPTLTEPVVLRAVLLSGASFSLIGLLGLGLGAIVRHTAAAIGLLVGGVWILAQLIGALAPAVIAYLPISIIANSLGTTGPETCGGHAAICPHLLSAWAGLGVLCLYVAVVLGVGGWLLSRRDA